MLDGHTPLVGDVVPGLVTGRARGRRRRSLAVHGGFVQVDTSPGAAEGLAEGDGPLPGLSTRVTVLAGVAELSSEIDVPRAEPAGEAASQRVADLRPGRGRRRRGADEALALAEAEGALAGPSCVAGAWRRGAAGPRRGPEAEAVGRADAAQAGLRRRRWS